MFGEIPNNMHIIQDCALEGEHDDGFMMGVVDSPT